MARARREYESLLAVVAEQSALLRSAGAVDGAVVARLDSTVARLCEEGHIPTLLQRPKVGVAVVVTRSDLPGVVLIGERKGSHGAGKWALPGGHLEFGQEFSEGGVRELEEETGLVVDAARCRHVGMTNDVMAEERLHYVTIFITVQVTAAEAACVSNREPDKCAGWHWLTWAEVRSKPIFLPLQHFLEGGMHAAL